MKQALWIWFLVLYVLGNAGFLGSILRFRRERARVEKQSGSFPPLLAVVAWLVPPLLLLSHAGELPRDWPLLRALGFALSLYALFIIQWSVRTLGPLLVPGRAVYQDHALVTSGPYRWVRHPVYSGAFALWLGAALGTLNWILLLLWPLAVAAIVKDLPAEEAMLREKFGAAYDAYAERTGRLVPGIRGRGGAEKP